MANDNKGDFLLGMLVGAAVGAAVALLYAPSSGEETRDHLRHTADDVRGRAGDLTGTVQERASGLAAQVRDRASSVASQVSSTVQDLSQRGKEMADQAQSAAQDAVDSASQAVSQAGGGGDLPDTGGGHKTGKRDQHELRTSDDPEVVADRINNAMQGSGEEAHQIAEDLAKSPSGKGSA